MIEKLGIDERKISELSNLLYKNYGTTMAGLRVYIFYGLISFK
jgi:putative hydrolase of the HAD superfamily